MTTPDPMTFHGLMFWCYLWGALLYSPVLVMKFAEWITH
jgi:hypothetical protein